MERKLKVKPELPLALELVLIRRYGYHVTDRIYGDCIIFSKNYISDGNSDKALSSWEKGLEKRCDNIVSYFPDPYKAVPAIRQRLHNMAQGLGLVSERKFVHNYMEENFPADA